MSEYLKAKTLAAAEWHIADAASLISQATGMEQDVAVIVSNGPRGEFMSSHIAIGKGAEAAIVAAQIVAAREEMPARDTHFEARPASRVLEEIERRAGEVERPTWRRMLSKVAGHASALIDGDRRAGRDALVEAAAIAVAMVCVIDER
jgi:hypothetical protein